ncbi:helix-turn-helix domain-containing protein [Photobacterium atrarenae]|uniref:Helix-turn-helix domain-containing protein n=1 Tax=Photobacterium atrarenae TaxID=865757 RepID=A0ABY5GMK4_9GAMM|nr:helix-turn-helix domain-containing protein [Photobacterium atrarenae]UTV29934.1 helix-turn-helix domain-containing protein [Photobacterium atrarenae]
MNYQTFQPHPDLESLISCYWTLEVPKTDDVQRQRIIPDGTIEMAFILGDDIKRYTSEDSFIIQPRAMVLGHTIAPFYIEPTGYVDTFAIRFYPYGFANFVTVPIKTLANTETPLAQLFEEKTAKKLEQNIINAADTKQRIKIIESFLLNKLNEQTTVDNILKTTIDTLFATKGSTSISKILKEDLSKRRQLERMFVKKIGVSPKQLGKLIRLQSALKAMLNEEESLTHIAYQNDYYDQSHFIKDFKEFTGVSPKEFLGNENMTLSSIFYK